MGKMLESRICMIRAMLRNDDCFQLYVTARGKGVRWGKSSLAVFLGKKIDPTMTPQQIVFTPFGWNMKLNELDPCKVIVKDEPRGSQRRRSMSADNFEQQEADTEWGYRNMAGIKIHPHIGQVDRAQLQLSDAWVEIIKKRELAVWHDIVIRTVNDPKQGPIMVLKTPERFIFRFPDAAETHPMFWAGYIERSHHFKATKEEPDYPSQVGEAEYDVLRKTYLRNRKMKRMRREVGYSVGLSP